jgi:hypothetical protein
VTAGAAVLWWMVRRPADRAAGVAVLRLLMLVSLTAQAIFYAWSPPRLVTDTAHGADSLRVYASTIVDRAPGWWVEYWGRLGWLEYAAPTAWYWALFATCVVLLGLAIRRPAPDAGLGSFLLVAGIGYAGLLLGSEYVHLDTAPLFIQGRYVLPVSLGLAVLVRQRSPALSWALPALVLALNVALAQATITRYFVGGWSSWFASLG